MPDAVNHRIDILDAVQESLSGIEDLKGGTTLGRSLIVNPPKEWTANLMPIAEPWDEYETDAAAGGCWDDQDPSGTALLYLNTFTFTLEVCRSGSGHVKEGMRLEAQIRNAMRSIPWKRLCNRFSGEGVSWAYPDPGTSTTFTFYAIEFTVEWFSGRDDLVHQPV